jgi:hypothetical protein
MMLPIRISILKKVAKESEASKPEKAIELSVSLDRSKHPTTAYPIIENQPVISWCFLKITSINIATTSIITNAISGIKKSNEFIKFNEFISSVVDSSI